MSKPMNAIELTERIDRDPECGNDSEFMEAVARALLDAHQRERREGMEEAAKVAGEEWRRWQNEPGSQIDTLDRASCRAIAAAIRAKAQEVKT